MTELIRCPLCKGWGKEMTVSFDDAGHLVRGIAICHACGGSGTIHAPIPPHTQDQKEHPRD